MLENGVVELDKGILQFGPISKPQGNEDLRVYVHPYHRDRRYETKLIGYATIRDKLITEERIPHILLVEETDLPSTTRMYRRPLFQSYRAILLTKWNSPEPLTRSWEELKNFIRSEFNPRRLFLSGATLCLDKEGKLEECGCVNNAYRNLKDLNPEIQVETCVVLK